MNTVEAHTPVPHREQDIKIETADCTLAGTLCTPEGDGPFPTAIMIHGSGPQDRNENMPGQSLDVFNTIAHSLAAIGVASVRYDKRGCGESTGDFLRTGHLDLVQDAVAIVDYTKELDAVQADAMFLLGHSEGCIISPQVLAARPGIRGLALLCPFIDDLESTLIKQARKLQSDFEGEPGLLQPLRKIAARIFGASEAAQAKLIQKLKITDADTFRVGFQKLPAKALREMLDLDPPAIFAKVDVPMLLIAGEKDVQCDPGDVDRIANIAQGPCETHIIPNLTHVLRNDEGEPNFLRYRKLIENPIEPEVTQLINTWFARQIA